MEENIKVFDLHRIFVGDAPLLFLLEIVFRTIIMYTYTIFLLRLLGKREMGQLSVLEVAIIISFGSAVGDPMVGANIPILYGIVAITTVAVLQIGLETLINKNKKVEAIMEGAPNLVVDNGVINLEALKNENMSQEDLFRSLRFKDVKQLGEIHKAYVETNGQVSVLLNAPKSLRPGLSVLPKDRDQELRVIKAKEPIKKTGEYCCNNCGATKTLHEQSKAPACEICACEEWTKATQ